MRGHISTGLDLARAIAQRLVVASIVVKARSLYRLDAESLYRLALPQGMVGSAASSTATEYVLAGNTDNLEFQITPQGEVY